MENFYNLSDLQTKTFNSYAEFEECKKHCRACPIGKIYDCVVPSDGNKINPKVVIIGEAPGKNEIEEGKPFIGKSGKLLRATLLNAGINESNSIITNTIPCRPENNKFPKDDSIVKNCKNMWLEEEIRILNPDILLLIGSQALKFLLNMKIITKVRGKWFNRRLNDKIIRVMPTYHPAYVLRVMYSKDKQNVKKEFEYDIDTVGKIISTT
jgi:DNA polymerase